VSTPLNASTVLLLALLQGPGYGLDLIERVRARSHGRLGLRQGAVYPALRSLEARRLVRSWTVNPPGRGRPRAYYELTPPGIGEALAEQETLAGFAANTTHPIVSRRELRAMRARLERCFEVTELATTMRRAGKGAGL
jgi:PadR family transcriptional regulator